MKTYKEFVAEGGPFSYGAKKPRKGSIAAEIEKSRKERDKREGDYEPRDQMVGVAKVLKKGVSEGRSVGTIPASVTAQLKKDAKRRERNVFHQIGTKLRDNVAKINAAAEQKK